MKPNSSILKIGAAIVLAMGVAACDNERPTDPQTPDVQTETQGQGDVDLYGPETQPGTATPGINDPAATPPPTTQPGTGMDSNMQTDPNQPQPGQGDVDLYGSEPEQNVPTTSPYEDDTELSDDAEMAPEEDQPLPARP